MIVTKDAGQKFGLTYNDREGSTRITAFPADLTNDRLSEMLAVFSGKRMETPIQASARKRRIAETLARTSITPVAKVSNVCRVRIWKSRFRAANTLNNSAVVR